MSTSNRSFAGSVAATMTLGQARSQDCKLGGSFSVWGLTYFEHYYTAIVYKYYYTSNVDCFSYRVY